MGAGRNMVVLRNLGVGVAKAKRAQGRVKQEGTGLGSWALESDFLVGILGLTAVSVMNTFGSK